MSIADKLSALSAVKAALRAAIEGKGVSVGSTPFAGWPGLISSIPVGASPPAGMIDGTATTLDLSAWPDTGSLRTQAFSNCSALTSITLPAGVTNIGTQVFYGSTLRKLVIQRTAGVVTLANVDAFGNSGITATTGNIYVPDALVSTYKTAPNWSTFADRIQPLSAYTP